jgi:hypothetical protein
VDSGSKATVKLVRDCSRFGRAEVLMSESQIFSVGCAKP